MRKNGKINIIVLQLMTACAIVLILLCCILLISCNKYSKSVEEALSLAGDNRGGLEKVLLHFQGDEYKYKAAEFLIVNMIGHSVPDSASWEKHKSFYQECDSITVKYKSENRSRWIAMVDSLWDVYKGTKQLGYINYVPLLKSVTAERMIAEIDQAFCSWKGNVFTKECSFEDFCEYILPHYRGNSFVLDDSRSRFYQLHKNDYYKDKTKTLTDETDSLLFLYRNIDFTSFNGSNIPALSVEALKQMGGGSCTERGVFNSLLLSALGIPVAVDFVPAWGSQNGSHSWNVLVVNDKHYAFDPFWGHNKWEHYNRLYGNTGIYDTNGQGEFRTPKVFRKTYSTHLECSLLGKGVKPEDIPPLFRGFKKKDVSADYFEVSDVEVRLTEKAPEGAKYAFLCVFDVNGWVPVQMGEIADGKVLFRMMGRNIVYLPVYYKGGNILPAAPPLHLKPDGSVQVLDGEGMREDSLVTRNVVVQSFRNRNYLKCMSGASIIGLNGDETGDTLCTISGILPARRNYFNTNIGVASRYIRINPPSDSIALGELSFYSAEGKIENAHVISALQDLSGKENVDALFDGFTSTCYRGKSEKKYVDIDLGGEYEVKYIVVAPYVMSQVFKNSTYELFYWKGGEWVAIEKQTGRGTDLIFKNVPGNALFRLIQNSDTDEKIKERVFLYKDGEVKWM